MPPARTRKRPAPVAVDLTQDETARTKRPALAAVSDDPTVLAGTQEPDPNELTQEPDEPATEFYGHLDNKIVGVRFYKGFASAGEAVLCSREPQNQYDSNAIRVDNVLHQQIGHLPRTVVEKIAPFMDSGDIKLEAELTGEKGMFDCPVRLSFFGPSDPAERERIEKGLKASRLIKATQLKQTKQQAQALRAATGLQSGSTSYGISSDADGVTQAELSLEELIKKSDATEFRRGGDAIKTLAIDEAYLAAMPMAEQPPQLASTLLPYQLQGLAWMTAKEHPQVPEMGAERPVQLWVKDSSKGMFWNLASGFVSPNAPKLCSGGILADDMGLGKTLQVISLILTGGSGPTLIVAPVSVMSNWKQQIARHVKPEQAPSVLVYHGNKKMTAEELIKYDVVIASYGRLAKERDQTQRTLLDKSVRWRRVVLDEGHTIRNARTKVALAACELQAESRWVLTGTPIVNSVKDLHSLVRFLHLTGGIEVAEIFNNSITRKLTAGEGGGQAILQALVQDICLRRKKDMKFVDLKLPEKKEFLHRIPFQPAEKVKYDALLSEARGALEEYQARSVSGQRGRFQNVLERLLRLRQTCNHWTLCRKRIDDLMKLLEEENVVVLNDKNRALLQEALRLYIESQDDCAICYEAPSPPVITNCKHVFCRPCITKAIQIQHKCPMCRNALTEDCLLEPAPEGTFDDNFDTDTQSSKTEALLQIVRATVQKPGSKVIIFSQWTSFLNIVQNQLVEAGLKFSRIDGSMNAEKRDRAIEALDHDADTRVMLASLAVCSVGLNLVAADAVILSDSWWAPAIEDQAIDRVHRLGQTRETTIWRLVMEDSVEERVLTIQAEKRELVGKAFCEKAKKDKVRAADVSRMLA
ncbi:SNF2 family helicase [Ophiocordyceps camponoti-floridani]|uniref:SNF2 family helicase n=1 Tax=Ophiocordyceps camponoti-floridani TaxID=2030778 RepID=A0A8H4Q698_9HYPO|nr:SNF2 family helicase [Ophiocordyceps camponoti-floridani]